jgi:hypothetical protein
MTSDNSEALLQAVGMAEATDEPIDLDSLADDLSTSVETILFELDQLQGMGLMSLIADEEPPRLQHAGSQWLARKGEWSHDVLHFLPGYIDDLYARDALLHGGIVLVDEFRCQLLRGRGVEHAREQLVPPAFAEAVDEAVALDLFAAAVALMARLSGDSPAGCLAEEIIAVGLLEDAKAQLEMGVDNADISEEEAEHARGELRGLFELFQDDDVLDLFEMSESADAALAGHDPIKQQLGVVDQRIEAWFQPFGGIPLTGYLHETKEARGG